MEYEIRYTDLTDTEYYATFNNENGIFKVSEITLGLFDGCYDTDDDIIEISNMNAYTELKKINDAIFEIEWDVRIYDYADDKLRWYFNYLKGLKEYIYRLFDIMDNLYDIEMEVNENKEIHDMEVYRYE